MKELTVGMKGRAVSVVTEQNTAAAVGSGLVPVFATPYMVALMENAAVNALLPAMEENEGTVGTQLSISHDAATPVGMNVWAEAEVTAVEGKKITLSVSAFDDCGAIGSGIHQRFVITVDRFLAKAEGKKAGHSYVN